MATSPSPSTNEPTSRPTTPSTTGRSRRPRRLTVSSVKRRPTCRPISAKASSRSTGGTTKSRPASTSAPESSIGPSSVPAGTLQAAGDQRAAGGDGERQQPVARVGEDRGRRWSRAASASAEDGDQHRRQQHDDEHPHVLHEGHEAVVGAEVVGHRDDPGGAAGDHPERRRRAVELGVAGEQPAHRDAQIERRRAHDQHRQPGVAEGLQRVGLQVGADRHAAHGLGGEEGLRRELAGRPAGASARRRGRPPARRTASARASRSRRARPRRRP